MDVTPHSSIPRDSPDTCLQVDAETDTGTSTVTRVEIRRADVSISYATQRYIY